MLTTRHFDHRYLAATEPGDRERLLIVLHGLGDSLRGFSFLPEALKINGLSYLFLNAPDPYYDGFSWYDFQGDSATGIRRSRELLLKLLVELKDQGVAARDTFLFGFSQGCLMVTDLGLRCPEVLGGICGVSGYPSFLEEYPAGFSSVATEQHFLITHGFHDPIVPLEPSAQAFKQLQSLGIRIDYRTYAKDHTLLMEELNDIAAWLRGRL